jgi:hypothetical protein
MTLRGLQLPGVICFRSPRAARIADDKLGRREGLRPGKAALGVQHGSVGKPCNHGNRAGKFEKVVPQILALAEENGLVCFDPQAGQVYLPPHLAAKQGGHTPPMAGSTPSQPKAE